MVLVNNRVTEFQLSLSLWRLETTMADGRDGQRDTTAVGKSGQRGVSPTRDASSIETNREPTPHRFDRTVRPWTSRGRLPLGWYARRTRWSRAGRGRRARRLRSRTELCRRSLASRWVSTRSKAPPRIGSRRPRSTGVASRHVYEILSSRRCLIIQSLIFDTDHLMGHSSVLRSVAACYAAVSSTR